MAVNSSDIRAAILPHLEEGEELKHWAYGVKQPSLLLIFLLCFLAIIPGVIALFFLTKNYIVGLTDRRFLVLRFKGKFKVTEISEYDLGALPEVKTSTGPVFTHIKISDSRQPFVAKFHRMATKDSREQSMAIAAALTDGPSP